LGKYNVTNSIVGNALFVKHKRLFFFLNLLAEKRVDKQSLKSNVFCFYGSTSVFKIKFTIRNVAKF